MGSRESEVQLRGVSHTVQRDNSALYKKVLLRERFTIGVAEADIYLAACGRGMMLRHVWSRKARYVLALDTDEGKTRDWAFHYPSVDARVADIEQFSDWPNGVNFQVADFDAYGSPYRAITRFFKGSGWTAPLYVFVTDGIPLWLRRGGFLPPELTGKQRSVRVSGLGTRRAYFEALVMPWWADLAADNGVRIDQRVVLWKRGRTVIYYALKLVAL